MNKEDILANLSYIIRNEKEETTKAYVALKALLDTIKPMDKGQLKEDLVSTQIYLMQSITRLMNEANELIKVHGHLSNLLKDEQPITTE